MKGFIMVMISFKNKRDKEHLLEKAKRMEDYASMIVECLENSDYDEYDERNYRDHHEDDEDVGRRYNYRRMSR